MTFFDKALSILSLLPALIKAAQELEKAIPLSGFGKEKAELILSIISDVGSTMSDMLPIVEKTLVSIVKLFKTVGIFK